MNTHLQKVIAEVERRITALIKSSENNRRKKFGPAYVEVIPPFRDSEKTILFTFEKEGKNRFLGPSPPAPCPGVTILNPAAWI